MRIAVYSISLNEERFVERWAKSAADADIIILADTGSTDDTVTIARDHGVTVSPITVTPWRFDDARNTSLALIPADIDYCVALDVDEILVDGWRTHLETALTAGWTRPRYRYVWSWNTDGTPGLVYGGDKIHRRTGYRWKHPVHEVLTATGNETQGWIGLEIHHHPDPTKSRSQYLPLLEQAVREDQHDDRNAFYFARELLFAGDRDRARAEFHRHLALPRAVWRPERAASMRYLAGLEPDDRETWLLRATAEAPERREPWLDLASHYHQTRNWAGCYAAATRALTIETPPLEYLCETQAWGALPHDLAAIAAYHLGMYAAAARHGTDAANLDPGDERLAGNLDQYRAALT